MNRKLFLTFSIALLLGRSAFGQAPVSNFNTNTTAGCAPLIINFTDASSNSPTAWAWVFPGGSPATSISRNQVVVFNTPGTYIVTLKASNASGPGTTASKTITVYPTPTADFSASATTGCFPKNIQFTDLSTAGTGASLTNWTYDYGDGTIDNGIPNPAHRYKIGGNFPVTLFVQNNYGCSGSAAIKTVSGYITLSNGVFPSFSDSLSASCSPPVNAYFTNQTTGPPALSYKWLFGDGGTSLITNPTHNYAGVGNYTVTMIATSSQGCYDTTISTVSISSSSNTSSFNVPSTVCAGIPVFLQNTSTPFPNSSYWTYSDGSVTDSAFNATHTFPSPSPSIVVTLHNNFSSCADSVKTTIVALSPPTPAFTSSNPSSCKPSLTVNFTDQSVNATGWTWDFGDGSTSILQNPSHTYTGYGSFTVTLSASNATGCSNPITKSGYVKVIAPSVVVGNLPDYGCAPLTYTPSYLAVAVDGVASYNWDFGNGNTYNTANPPAQVYGAGKYAVKVSITSNGGCTASYVDTVKVGTIKPTAAFSAAPLTACIGQAIQFTDQSAGAPNQWYWQFGDGSTDSSQSPKYSYTRPGTYTVNLTAYNNGCNDMVSKVNYIVINPPLAGFTSKYDCSSKNQYTFTDISIGATSWDWDFGDGSAHFLGQNPPPHTYPNTQASYTVIQKASTATCSNTATQNVNVLLKTTISTSANPVCKNTLVTVFTTHPANIVSYAFDFGDGATAGSGSGATSHTYTAAGSYTIKVITTDNIGCIDSAFYSMQINGPQALFTAPVTLSCGSFTESFSDQSLATGALINSWAWDFGDGTSSILQNPIHAYSVQGTYPVKLKVTDASGCSDSLIKGNFITLSVPKAKFTTPDSLYCPSSFIKFSNVSQGGYSPTYTWDFGDGTTSTATNPPPHNYATPPSLPDTFTVSLTLKDLYGCMSTYTKIKYIIVDTPKASFSLSATTSSCPPLIDSFIFTGTYGKSILWNFGDGANGVGDTAVHIYGQPGDWYPVLTVTSPGGCVAQASQHVHVDGPLGAFTYNPLSSCDSLNVTFNVTSGNATKFIWFYADGIVSDTMTLPTISHEYYNPGHFLPYVVLIDATGCAVIKQGIDSIYIDSIQQTSFSIDKNVLCDSGFVTFTSTSKSAPKTVISNYSWDFGDGVTISGNNPNPTHHYLTSGLDTVRLVITSLYGCTDSSKAVVRVVASPAPDILGAVNQCMPATETFTGILLVADTSSVLNWAWDFKNGQTSSLQNPPAQLYPKGGNYIIHLQVTNSSGCVGSKDSSLLVYPNPDVSAGNDTTICLGQILPLQASGAATYSWLPPTNGDLSCTNCSNPFSVPTGSTYYIVNGTSALGCQNKDTINVTVNQPTTLSVSAPDSVCIGQSTQLTASGAALYAWSPAAGLNDATIANPVATPSTTTNYRIIGSDNLYCFSDTQYIKISVFNYPSINAGSDVSIPVGTSYQISASGTPDIVSIIWSPVTALSCTACLTPLASPNITTNYVIKAINDGGCSAADSIKITVVCNGTNFFIPNTFSPNGDGVNDRFVVRGTGLNIIPSIQIYNRWGQLIFEKSNFAPNDESAAWDGTVDGKPAPADVYIYTVQILCNNAALIPYHGNLTLIR